MKASKRDERMRFTLLNNNMQRKKAREWWAVTGLAWFHLSACQTWMFCCWFFFHLVLCVASIVRVAYLMHRDAQNGDIYIKYLQWAYNPYTMLWLLCWLAPPHAMWDGNLIHPSISNAMKFSLPKRKWRNSTCEKKPTNEPTRKKNSQ